VAERGVAGRLERGREPKTGRLAVQRDDARTHPAGGAADYYICRRGAYAPDGRRVNAHR
jgi:hypothetical protein